MKKITLFLAMLVSVSMLAFTSCGGDDKPEIIPPVENEYKFEVDTKALIFGATDAEARTIAVTAEGGFAWSIEFDEASAPWLHLSQKTKSVEVTVDDSTQEGERTATFTLTASELTVEPIEITVTQTKLVSLDAMPKELTFMAMSSAYNAGAVNVEAVNTEWDIEVPAGSEWIHPEIVNERIAVKINDNRGAYREGKFIVTSDVEGVADVEITVKQESGEFVLARGEYWANVKTTLADVDGGEFILGFVSAPNIEPETGNILGDGYILKVNIVAPYPAAGDKNPKIADGKYEVNGRQEQYSIINHKANDNSKISIAIENELAGELFIEGGYMNTKLNGDNYDMEFNFELSDGTSFVSSYSGPIGMTHMDLISTNYSDRDSYMRGGGGYLDCWGDTWSNTPDGSWEWDFWIWGEGMTWDAYNRDIIGAGDLMRITIQHAPTDNQEILPAGTYIINGSGMANTALWGGWDIKSQVIEGMWGSWWLDYDSFNVDENGTRIEGEYGNLETGTIEIQYNSDTQIYNIIVDAYDDMGNKIDCDFEGKIVTNYIDDKAN